MHPRELLSKLLKHRMSLIGGVILVILYILMILAEFIAPYHFDDEDRKLQYAPPSKIRFVDKEGKFHLQPFVYRQYFKFNHIQKRVWYEDTSKRYPLSLFAKAEPYKLLGIIPMKRHLFGAADGGRIYLFGADPRGRDLFSRIVYGSRVSLTIGFFGVFISTIIGVFVGGIAGYLGGKTDTLLMRFCEMVMLFPSFFLLLVLRYMFPVEMPSVQLYFVIVFILSFIGWASLARVIRGMTKSIREREYVQAAEAIGQRRIVIIFRHILPQTYSYLVISLTLSIPGYILGESALSFLGLGIVDPYCSWGNLLEQAQSFGAMINHPWFLIPGIFIFVTVMAYNMLGDGLRDILDPKSAKR